MKDAQVMVVNDLSDLNEVLEANGIDLGGRTAIPLAIPVDSLDDLPTALKNLGINADSIAGTIKAEVEKPEPESELYTLREATEALRQENARLADIIAGIKNSLA